MNYYELLEVSPNASDAVVRAAYKSLMQHYHPDKHPGDAEIARRAALVVQAYGVLSDSSKRSAYDRELELATQKLHGRYRHDAGDHVRVARAASRRPENGGRSWLLWLMVTLAILAGWSILPPLRATFFVEPEPVTETGRRAMSPDAAVIPVLITELSVTLRDAGGPSMESQRVLFVPVLGVRVGPQDTEYAARHLKNTADQIRRKLEEDLANARFEELIRPDGEQYLAKMMLRAINEVGRASGSPGATSMGKEPEYRYGATEILMPQSFSVR